MLRKLLKYDMKSVFRYWWIIAVSMVALTAACAISLRFMLSVDTDSVSPLLIMLAILVLIFSIVGFSIATVFTFILIHLRFYNHLYTDEGYLTFTLPVSRGQILMSKTLNAMIWTTLHYVLMIICIVALVAVCMDAEAMSVARESLAMLWQDIWTPVGAWFVLYALVAIILLLILSFMSISLVQLCITVAATLVKKAKLLVAILIYYSVNMAVSLGMQLFGYMITLGLLEGLSMRFELLSVGAQRLFVLIIMLIACLIFASVALLFYMITRNVMERKLNLA